MTFVGEFYRTGTFVEQSFELAIASYERAVDLENESSALMNLGMLHLEGSGVNQEYSFELFTVQPGKSKNIF
jgi:TPR repeat protein